MWASGLGFEQVTALHGPPAKTAVRVNEARRVTTPDGLTHKDTGVLDGELGLLHRDLQPHLVADLSRNGDGR